MSCFDNLIVTCPKCGEKVEFQCKNGKREMDNYDVSNVPPEIAGDLNGEKEQCCKCGVIITIQTQCFVTISTS